MRARKDEAPLILAALEKEYDTPDQAANAVLGVCAVILSHRPGYVVTVRTGEDEPLSILYGSFMDRRAAAAFMKKMQDMGLVTRSVPVFPVHTVNTVPPRSRFCKREGCAHPLDIHDTPRAKKRGCHAKGCTCRSPM